MNEAVIERLLDSMTDEEIRQELQELLLIVVDSAGWVSKKVLAERIVDELVRADLGSIDLGGYFIPFDPEK